MRRKRWASQFIATIILMGHLSLPKSLNVVLSPIYNNLAIDDQGGNVNIYNQTTVIFGLASLDLAIGMHVGSSAQNLAGSQRGERTSPLSLKRL